MVLLAFIATNTKLPAYSFSAAIAVTGMAAESRSTRLSSRAITLLCIFLPPCFQYRQFHSRYRIFSQVVHPPLQASSTRTANESTCLRCSGVISWVLNSAF